MTDSDAKAELTKSNNRGLQEAEAPIELSPDGEWKPAPPQDAALSVAAEKRSGVLQRWAPILMKFTSVQMVVQAIGFAAGILIVRNLPKHDYALYTLANTMLGTVLLLADSGISSALTAIGGRVWQDRAKLSQLIRTAMQLRRWIAAIMVPIVTVVLVWLLRKSGASVSKVAILVMLVLLGCGLEMVTRIYAVALRLKSEVQQIQKQALTAAFVRLAVVGIAIFFWFNVEIAIVAVVAGFAVQYWMLRQWHTSNLDEHAPIDPEMRSEILSVVKKQATNTIYYCVQAPLMIMLISIFGNADDVAGVGALGRLAVVFAILGSVTSEILFPAFSRIRSTQMVRRRYLQIIFGFVIISAALIGIMALFPEQVLAVLGPRYSHLQAEGILMAISTVLGAIEGLAWGLNSARAWIVQPMMFIPFDIAVLATLIHFLDVSTIRGVIVLSILSTIPSIAWAICLALLRIHKLQATG